MTKIRNYIEAELLAARLSEVLEGIPASERRGRWYSIRQKALSLAAAIEEAKDEELESAFRVGEPIEVRAA